MFREARSEARSVSADICDSVMEASISAMSESWALIPRGRGREEGAGRERAKETPRSWSSEVEERPDSAATLSMVGERSRASGIVADVDVGEGERGGGVVEVGMTEGGGGG